MDVCENVGAKIWVDAVANPLVYVSGQAGGQLYGMGWVWAIEEETDMALSLAKDNPARVEL